MIYFLNDFIDCGFLSHNCKHYVCNQLFILILFITYSGRYPASGYRSTKIMVSTWNIYH